MATVKLKITQNPPPPRLASTQDSAFATLEVSHTPPSFMARGTTPIAPNIVKLSGLQGADYSVSHINQVPGDRQSEEQVEVLIS